MENIIISIRPYVEILYFVSQIVIVFIAAFGLRQIKIAKEQLKSGVKQVSLSLEQVAIGIEQVQLVKFDIETRNKRLAVEKSLDYIQRFSTVAFEKYIEYKQKLKAASLPTAYQGSINSFNDTFIGVAKEEATKRMSLDSHLHLNEFELFATAMVNKIADEEVAFIPLSKEYCRMVEESYDVICLYRANDIEYANLVTLYNIWSGRRKKKDLDMQISKLEEVKASIYDSKITPIGVRDN